MKATKNAIKALIEADTSLVFSTYLTGYPVFYPQEILPCVSVFSMSEEPKWSSTGYNKTTLTLGIEIGISAKGEEEQADRGEANEDFLNDAAEVIRDLLFETDQVCANVEVNRAIRIEYRIREGDVRVATIAVECVKRIPR